jgi:hypothetical protein
MSELVLGRVKTFCLAAIEPYFFGFDYALRAAMSGLVPMMFISRVRL